MRRTLDIENSEHGEKVINDQEPFSEKCIVMKEYGYPERYLRFEKVLRGM